MQNDLIHLKQNLITDNALKLKIIIENLMEEINNPKMRLVSKTNAARAIAECVQAQMKLFDDVPPITVESELYLKVLNAPEGKIGRQTLLDDSDDYKTTWDALQHLEQANVIDISSNIVSIITKAEAVKSSG